ncbi:hypothetical protein GJ496_006951 [Pomphorhynchus laevis]|nr:hypothetical protein GJ496_006951 [Pomphorhynchus laevis]
MREVFARQGLPEKLVVDNEPPFQSWEFKKFLAYNGTKLVNVTPHHPKSNGLAERFVGVLKQRALSHTPIGQRPLKIQQMLLSYRNTPHASTGKSPAFMLYGRRLCTMFDRIRPTLALTARKAIEKYKFYKDTATKCRSFQPRQAIWYRCHKGVANDNASSIHYKTTDPIRVHADQLRNRVCQESELSEADDIENAQTQCARNDEGNSCHSTSNVWAILVQFHNRRIHNDQPSVNNDSRNEETFEDERNTANLEESVRRSTRIRRKSQRYGFD